MGTILKAEHHNWGLTTMFSLQSICYELNNDGILHIVVNYVLPVVDSEVQLSNEDFLIIQTLIPEMKTEEKVQACDESAWSFVLYDETGKVMYERQIGYIYGIKSLESTARILEKYVPDYEEPSVSYWKNRLIEEEGKKPESVIKEMKEQFRRLSQEYENKYGKKYPVKEPDEVLLAQHLGTIQNSIEYGEPTKIDAEGLEFNCLLLAYTDIMLKKMKEE